MSNKKMLVTSLVIGFLVTAIAWLPFSFSELALYPGMLVAALFWPEGIHTGNGLGANGVVAFVSVIWLGAFLAWSILSYASLLLLHRLRAP
ncbi:MAG: hypothetical protein ACREPB_03270 [Arenimonas sp.]